MAKEQRAKVHKSERDHQKHIQRETQKHTQKANELEKFIDERTRSEANATKLHTAEAKGAKGKAAKTLGLMPLLEVGKQVLRAFTVEQRNAPQKEVFGLVLEKLIDGESVVAYGLDFDPETGKLDSLHLRHSSDLAFKSYKAPEAPSTDLGSTPYADDPPTEFEVRRSSVMRCSEQNISGSHEARRTDLGYRELAKRIIDEYNSKHRD